MNKELSKFGDVKTNISLSKLSTFKIGGIASFLLTISSVQNLVDCLYYLKKNKIPFFVLGNGSNVLFSDEGFLGVIISLKKLNAIKYEDELVESEAGVLLSNISKFCLENELAGLEFLNDIPGTVGGAICTNAHSYGHKIFDYIESVKKIKSVVVSVKFKLKKSNKELIKKELTKFSEKRKTSQPKGLSAGCIFSNPKNFKAGELIDKTGLKGVRVGGAVVSNKHANFIINSGIATAKDVLELTKLIKEKVFEKFKVTLKLEINIIDKYGKQINI